MPTRKQRRRQQKSRRHEYEYVYVDDEGQEVEVDASELKAKKEERAQTRERRTQGGGRQAGRPARTVQPPSWNRVAKRALMVGPFVVLAMFLLNKNMPVAQRILPAIVLLAFFLPFSYFTDSMAYRMYRKRLDRTSGTGGAKGS